MKETQIALIPAFEPDEMLLEIAEELRRTGLDIIIVNDGSGEKYREVFTEAEQTAVVLHHEKNRGKGAAIKTGLSYAARHYTAPYAVVTVDADGQHRAEDVMSVLKVAQEEDDNLVLGSRRFTGRVPLKSRLGNAASRLIFRLVSGIRIYDTQTGLRAFSDSLVKELMQVGGERYEYEMNVLMRFAREKRPIREVWIETVYLNENASSHFRAIVDSIRICGEILKFSAASLAGFTVDCLLFCLLNALTGRLILSNVLARVMSASLNFSLNRRAVFQSDAPLVRSAARYAVLAVLILAGNTVLLQGLSTVGWNRYASKIVTELVFFSFSWLMQRTFVFCRNEVDYEKA